MKKLLPIVFCFAALCARAATSTAWETNSFADFARGRLTGLMLTADGFLKPGPSVRFDTALDQPALWSVALAPDGSTYAATGHRGTVLHVGRDGKTKKVWAATQSEVFAVTADAKGVVYAGTSPNGGLFRIAPSGEATEVWHSPAKYIWALQSAPDGGLFIGTGDRGTIYHLGSNGQAEPYYETGQANITALLSARNGHLYAGSEPNGLLYEITARGQGTVVYDSTLPEIRALALDGDGSIYIAAMGGSVASRSAAALASSPAAPSAVIANSPTVVTVTEAKKNGPGVPGAENEQSAADLKPRASTGAGSATSTMTPVSATPSASTEVAGADKSAVYRIRPDRSVETLRTSKEENIYDLQVQNGQLFFLSDVRGRLYQWSEGKADLLAEGGDGDGTRLVAVNDGWEIAMSNPARLVALSPRTKGGTYQSPVHDSNSVARWGHLQWHGGSDRIEFRTRTGNSARPDATWGNWQVLKHDAAGWLITSTNARYIQWEARWPETSQAALDTVDIPYLPQNAPPAIRSVSVTSINGTNAAKSAATASSNSSAYSTTVTDTGEAPAAATTTSSSSAAVSRINTTQTQITWQADDPDGDKLTYTVYFRAEEGATWQLIRTHVTDNSLTLDPDVLADGRYLFRVVASDAPSNASIYAQKAELVSSPVLIDNTPPVIVPGRASRGGDGLDIDMKADDATSPIRRGEYSLDAGPWQPVEAVDGITDSPHEQFHVHLDKVKEGEHLLVFRVYDSAGNAGLAKTVIH